MNLELNFLIMDRRSEIRCAPELCFHFDDNFFPKRNSGIEKSKQKDTVLWRKFENFNFLLIKNCEEIKGRIKKGNPVVNGCKHFSCELSRT